MSKRKPTADELLSSTVRLECGALSGQCREGEHKFKVTEYSLWDYQLKQRCTRCGKVIAERVGSNS